MEICYEVINTNRNDIYIQINACLKGYNKHELYARIDSGCAVYFGKRSLLLLFMWKKAKKSLKVRIANNGIMSLNEAIEELSIEIGGVQYIIPVL